MKWAHRWDRCLAFSRCHQVLDEEGVKGLILVLLDQGGLHVGAKLAWLFLELVDRDLSDHKRKVFCGSFHLATLRVETHGDVSLVGKTKFLVFTDVVDVLILADRVLWASAVFTCLGSLWVDLSS